MNARIVALVAAVALLVPQGAAADCRLPMLNMYRGYGAAGSFKITAGANFGLSDSNDQTIIGADGSYSLSDQLGVRFGLGRCSSGSLAELTFGAQLLSDVWASEDGTTKLQGAFGFNRVDFNGAATTVLPLQLNVRYAVAPTVDLWGGPELAMNRFSAASFSSSETNLGLNAGVTADLNETVTFRTGLSAQFWEGSTAYGLGTALSLKLPQSN